MRLRIIALSVLVLVCSLAAASQKVVESESGVLIREQTAEVVLAIDSASVQSGAPVMIAILAPDNTVVASVNSRLDLAAGKKKYEFSIAIGDLMKTASDEIAWYRLQYAVGSASGIVSLSQLTRNDFDLRAASFAHIVPGEVMRVRVRSLDPFSEKAVSDVAIKVELKIDLKNSKNDDLRLSAAGKTDRNGIATIDFKIPPDIKPDGDGKINITGQKLGVVRKIEEDLDDNSREGTLLLTTDKPLYQPGQNFNIRAIYLDANNTVVPERDLEFSIEDEEETVVFRQTVKTSAFGIASVEWPIPESAKLGSYHVRIESDDNDVRENELSFKVSRYDLPNFSVTAAADRKFYLPSNTTAEITVSADYLFGKPVTQGSVRIVEEGDRHWNYREQKYDFEEGKSVEGKTDANGKYICQWDLKDAIANLGSNQWERYKDISLSAYYTDLSTNRTEQRRFDIRLTKEPIHIYFIRYADQSPDLPIIAYISTFYADGTPAVCDVKITDIAGTVASFKTNALGAGKVEIEIPKVKLAKMEYFIHVNARDKKGQQGTFDESFYMDEADAMQIRTEKTIYTPGEIVEADLVSTQQNGYVYVDLVKDWAPVDSRLVELHHGRAHVSIPYRSSFKGDLLIAAYTDKEEGRWSRSMRAARGIIFPEQQNLLLNARFTKEQYRPGEEAAIRFSVLDGSHNPVESAIGLGIFDKAIEERARTETEFGGYFRSFYSLLGYDRSFGNLSLKDLNDLDLSQPISPEMQLAAEVMLAPGWYFPAVYHSANLDAEAKTLYSDVVAKQLAPVKDALNTRYARDRDHPVDQASLKRILANAGIDVEKLRDPWGNEYVAEFSIKRENDVVLLKTMGPDETADTPDDFTVLTLSFDYFRGTGEALDRAVLAYHNRTGGYIRDLQTLVVEAAKEGVDLSSAKDRWGHPHRVTFGVSGRNYVIELMSPGPDGVYEVDRWRGDDFSLWRNTMDYFGGTEDEINRILDLEVNGLKKPFPRSVGEFEAMLKRNKLDIRSVNDGYGRPVYVSAVEEVRYGDKTSITDGKTVITPVTEQLMSFRIRSKGENGVIDGDDSDLVTFSAAITTAYKGTGFARADVTAVPFSGAKGALSGAVLDQNGAVIPNATVTAIDEKDNSAKYSTLTNDEGRFLIANIPSGKYSVLVEATGFGRSMYSGVTVMSQSRVEMNITMRVAGASAMVTVAAVGDVDQSSNATSANISTKYKTGGAIQFPYREQTSTPRLREYFPETLVWQPELLTDKKGKAGMTFKMADDITTWKMFAIASTKKGKVGVVEKEITAFQPFFADLDPPKFLTEGDEIYLPTQIRNYTDKKQKVAVTMDRAAWFSFLSPEKQQVDVEAGASQNAVFGFKATAAVKGGKQRVTAIAQTDSDAIEKPVTVRANGQEVVRTESKVTSGDASFDIAFPSNALPRTQQVRLKVYPNLFSHVADSVEGLLERPYGCGEQTISSTYPNLMILKFVKAETPLRQKAKRYLRTGYDRLLGYQTGGGGFSYWGPKDSPDVALTAYAIRFLNDAREIDVDENVIKNAEAWLVKQQRADGSWTKQYSWETTEDRNRTRMTTALVARSLAMLKDGDKPTLARAIQYLAKSTAEIDEPYVMALFGLASLDAGNNQTASETAARLEQMAINEGDTAYWNLETNTPFYGWGTAGRVETTALVLQLLIHTAQLPGGHSSARDAAISKGTAFLLKNKDRYGVWYSTQATINVLDAFLAALRDEPLPQDRELRVSVNGRPVRTLPLKGSDITPVDVDVSNDLDPSANRIDVAGAEGQSMMMQVVAAHYVDWRDSTAANKTANESRGLSLEYNCDKTSVPIMGDVTCSVAAERIGFKGYGMLLAEIGTPPGADVSRESLEKAIADDWSIGHYDILPDRIVIYMWSKAGGTHFSFKFRPRYGINAQTPASIVYDYYNPEAHATVAPLRFAVK